MRRLLVGMVVTAITVLAPTVAWAGNQQVAEQIAANLRQSGLLHDYRIGVRYQDGTAWLRGRVSSQEQIQTALKLAVATPEVTRVVNNLQIGSREVAAPAASSDVQPLRQVAGAVTPERLPRLISPSLGTPAHRTDVGLVDRVATSFAATPVQPVAATTREQPTLLPAQNPVQPLLEAPATPTMLATPRAIAPPGRPIPIAYTQGFAPVDGGQAVEGPIPQYVSPVGGGVAPARYDQPHLPNCAWPGYAAYPNYAGLTYPKQYSPTAWPYIGPFYPYPQVPLGWRKVTLEWHDGWWQLDFDDGPRRGIISGLFRPCK